VSGANVASAGLVEACAGAAFALPCAAAAGAAELIAEMFKNGSFTFLIGRFPEIIEIYSDELIVMFLPGTGGRFFQAERRL
jgi:hypothetical protein